MKPFNLEKALTGEPVVMRDGQKVMQIHYESYCLEKYSVCAYVESEGWETFRKIGVIIT